MIDIISSSRLVQESLPSQPDEYGDQYHLTVRATTDGRRADVSLMPNFERIERHATGGVRLPSYDSVRWRTEHTDDAVTLRPRESIITGNEQPYPDWVIRGARLILEQAGVEVEHDEADDALTVPETAVSVTVPHPDRGVETPLHFNDVMASRLAEAALHAAVDLHEYGLDEAAVTATTGEPVRRTPDGYR